MDAPNHEEAPSTAPSDKVPQTESFSQHYATLRQCVATLKMQTEPNLDILLPLVDEALDSYKICKERIAAVRMLLAEKFVDSDAGKN